MTAATRTLGEFVEQQQILGWLGREVAAIHARSSRGAREAGRSRKLVVQCTTCTAAKSCCSSFVIARLYEGLLIAGELVRTQRDTPALREQLRARTAAMQQATQQRWFAPCLFLDGADRCTVYAVRPATCAALNVYTPPALCNARSPDVLGYVASDEIDAANELEEQFRERLALRKKVGRRYLGLLPEMVLIALEAWGRSDFRDHLRQLAWPTDEQIARWAEG